ncbi:hypothetical protein BCT96_020205 [Vibrio splendidus]|uniref:hypothetical protein n=1 Tax=Vibrio splendidus TaxID=29497 RepID=UPI001F5359DC|nr:hypothetical protein [Vibrio splendidus]
MAITRRKQYDRITYEQAAKLILLFSQHHRSRTEEGKKRFKVREELIQKVMGIPLSHDDRFSVIREFNLLGWQVAITLEHWLVFVVDEDKLFNWDEATYPYGLEQAIRSIQEGKQPPLADIHHYYRISSNETAKFFGWSDEEIQERLIEEALEEAPEEIQDEYEEDGDASILNIERDEICLTNFTSWEYLEHQLVENGLVFKSK